MVRAAFVLLAFVLLCQNGYSQHQSPGILYKNETSFGLLLHTRGFGGSLQFTKQITAERFRLFDINLYGLKSPKEIKLPNPEQSESQPFVYGKTNNFIVLKANYGYRRILADKNTPESVRVNLNYSIGPDFGMLKPIYYDVKVRSIDPLHDQTNIIQAKFDPDNYDNQRSTVGQSPFTKGLGESAFIFGANAKSSLSFEWGNTDYKFYSLEVGAMLDAFPVDVPIFADKDINQKVFLNLFLTLSYGTRR